VSGDAPGRDPLQVERDRRAALVHDLRTPLTLVTGFADVLVRRGAELPAEQRDDLLARIADAAHELGRILDADRAGPL
jgi:K+-sensing histidine kinase KdpD